MLCNPSASASLYYLTAVRVGISGSSYSDGTSKYFCIQFFTYRCTETTIQAASICFCLIYFSRRTIFYVNMASVAIMSLFVFFQGTGGLRIQTGPRSQSGQGAVTTPGLELGATRKSEARTSRPRRCWEDKLDEEWSTLEQLAVSKKEIQGGFIISSYV